MYITTLIAAFILFLSSVANSAIIDNYFINQSYGARIMAMGEASTALCGDAEGIYSNPATNGFIDNIKIASSYNDYYNSSFMQASFSAAIPIADLGVFSFGIPLKIINNIPLTSEQSGEFVKTGDISNLAVAGYLSYAKQLDKSFSAGVSVKMIKEKLYNSIASGIGYDMGVAYKLDSGIGRITLAASILDMGNTALFWDTEHFDYLPMTTRLGAMVESELSEGKLRIAMDILSRESGSSVAFGGEYESGALSLRCGMNDRNDHMVASYGLGLQVGNVCFDYGVQNDEDMGVISKFSTAINF